MCYGYTKPTVTETPVVKPTQARRLITALVALNEAFKALDTKVMDIVEASVGIKTTYDGFTPEELAEVLDIAGHLETKAQAFVRAAQGTAESSSKVIRERHPEFARELLRKYEQELFNIIHRN